MTTEYPMNDSAHAATQDAPDGQFVAGQTKPAVICGARTRETGEPCKRAPVPGRTRCKLHGGHTLRGAESGTFKHGLYSKALPKGMKATYAKLMSDPDMLSAKGEVALLQVRLAELAARVGSNASVENWRAAQTAFREFRTANANQDAPAMMAALNRLQTLLDGAVDHDAAWEALTEAIEKTTNVQQKEWKRLNDNQQTATYEQVTLIVTSIAEAVLLHVKDQAARLAIADHINKLAVVPWITDDGHGGVGPARVLGEGEA